MKSWYVFEVIYFEVVSFCVAKNYVYLLDSNKS